MYVFYRPIGKASSETRLYFTASELYLSDLLHAKQAICSEPSFNVRASYLSSEHIYGNAILASVGYTWKSKDLLHEDLSLQSYYRSLLICSLLYIFTHISFITVFSKAASYYISPNSLYVVLLLNS